MRHATTSVTDDALEARIRQLLRQQQKSLYDQTDKLFAGLLIFEYLAGIFAAVWIAPYTWSGLERQLHPHLWDASILGLFIVSLPVCMALFDGGTARSRQVIAIAQMAMAGLLIHLTGGRIETHFLVFGSLAFLAFYRDWRVLVTASAVTAIDHIVRGYLWPQSIYGVEAASSWRWLEHAGWVVFEDLFLLLSCLRSNRAALVLAQRQIQLEEINANVESQVRQRTAELETSRRVLEETNAQFSGVLSAATQISIIATDVNGLITVFNSGSESMLGYSAAEMIGKVTPQMIHVPEEIELRSRQLSQEFGRPITGFEVFIANAREGRFDRSEWTYVRKDGGRLTVSLTVTAVRNLSGDLTGFLGVAEDITVRKLAEQQLIVAREQAEQAARAKSDFLANMSHEIRTPMNGIIGMTELALDTNLTAVQRDYVETVKSSADSLLRIINDILDFSKIEAGRLELDRQPFELRESLGDAMKTLAVRAHEKNLELFWHIPADVPDGLVGDVGRLRQVVVNLVGNAIKFTEHGEVGVTVELVSRTDTSSRLRFSVNDTGMGIPEDKQRVIFEPFAQADASTTRTHGGTGLGLSISRQIVELIGGEISVHSTVGQGSTFHFTVDLPLATDSETDCAEVNLEGARVLVVDDNATNRRILEDVLRHWNMKPVSVHSGQAAIQELLSAEREHHPFQLVLTDCHMPQMDGFMFVEEIRKHSDLISATIMMLTSGAYQGALERCRELGIAATLLKPVKQSELQRAIAVAMGKSKAGARKPKTVVPPRLPQSLKILLAEDNPVNQRVAVRMLEKMGHTIQVVGNGQLALDAAASSSFDLILMDIQMPVLDGLSATIALRKREQDTGGHLPVIAMTAHAMAGDCERCLAAGMDAYVSKPIESSSLSAALSRAMEKSSAIKTTAPINPDDTDDMSSISEPVYDHQAALERLDGDDAFLSELADVFLGSISDLLTQLDAAVQDRNPESISDAAHAIKGAVSNFCAQPAFDKALSLEVSCGKEDLDTVEVQYRELLHEIDRLSAVLRNELIAEPIA